MPWPYSLSELYPPNLSVCLSIISPEHLIWFTDHWPYPQLLDMQTPNLQKWSDGPIRLDNWVDGAHCCFPLSCTLKRNPPSKLEVASYLAEIVKDSNVKLLQIIDLHMDSRWHSCGAVFWVEFNLIGKKKSTENKRDVLQGWDDCVSLLYSYHYWVAQCIRMVFMVTKSSHVWIEDNYWIS